MIDVARVAGVSAQTVSRVLSDHPNVSADTRARVLDAVERTGYFRNRMARALVTGRSHTLGVLIHQTGYHAGTAIMMGIQAAACEHGYFVTTAATEEPTAAAVRRAAFRLLDAGVDGLLIAIPASYDGELERIARGWPTVIVDQLGTGRSEAVVIDQIAAGRMATEHLLSLGHRDVVHVSGPESWHEAMGRGHGWRSALAEAGRPTPPLVFGDWSPASGYRAGEQIAEMPEVSAVFAASDEMALGMLHALHDRGRRVPEDISVVGMDDIPLAAHGCPPLTTVRQPFEQLGRRSVDHLVGRLLHPETPPSAEVLMPELMVRSSTAPPRNG